MKYSKYEMARIIGARALQIAMGAPFLVKINKEELDRINYDCVKIAKKEFEGGVLPITIKRPLPSKVVEEEK